MAFVLSYAAATALLAALAAAVPAPAPAPAPALAPDFEPFNESDPTVVKRWANWWDFGEFDGSSSAKGYQDGQGSYVKSGDEARYGALGLGEHCWTDLFWVSKRIDAANWVRDESSIDCATSSQCYIEKVKSGERCNSWDLHGSISGSVGSEILAKFAGLAGEIGLEAGGGGQTCETSESSTGCYWEDKLCHTAWRSDLTLVHEGYIRRRCDKGGDHTVWMHDFETKVPIKETRVGCAALCGTTVYPEAVPAV